LFRRRVPGGRYRKSLRQQKETKPKESTQNAQPIERWKRS
jgi:hypothetical protein